VIPVPPFCKGPADGDAGLPVDDLIAAVKHAIKAANVSATEPKRDLAVTSVYLKR
jgi:hypothetical protein